MNTQLTRLAAVLALASLPLGAAFAEGEIDASDPTKIATYAGPGVKFTDFANGDSLLELRATGNIGLGDNDMVMFELGYGSNNGTISAGQSDSGLTNGRARWFHLFEMKPVVSGYRGMATQIDGWPQR